MNCDDPWDPEGSAKKGTGILAKRTEKHFIRAVREDELCMDVGIEVMNVGETTYNWNSTSNDRDSCYRA